MKKLMIAAVGLLVASCSQIELPEAEMEAQTGESRKFTFTVKGDFLSPEFREGGPRKANAYMTADGVEMTDLWVVDVVGGDIRQSLHQVSTDADWGAPTMSLSLISHLIRGTYRLRWSAAQLFPFCRCKVTKYLPTYTSTSGDLVPADA